MSKLFSTEGSFYAVLSLLADLIILNLLMLFTAIPLFTIGPVLATGYAVVFALIEQHNYGVVKCYFSHFKTLFRRTFGGGMVLGFLLIFGIYEIALLNYFGQSSAIGLTLRALLIGVEVWLLAFATWYFPLAALTTYPQKQLVLVALDCLARNLVRTIVGVVICIGIPIAFYFGPWATSSLLWAFLFLGWPFTLYLVALVYRHPLTKWRTDQTSA